jgi:hypothetical protein
MEDYVKIKTTHPGMKAISWKGHAAHFDGKGEATVTEDAGKALAAQFDVITVVSPKKGSGRKTKE